MKKVKGFSYDSEEDKDVIEYIKNQPHQASYVWNLVRKDMCKTENNIEELVKKYVKIYCKDIKINDEPHDISIDSINDLLNIGNG